MGDRGLKALCEVQDKRIRELEALVAMGVAVVDDFLPNIGKCALQDYGRMNDFMVQARPIATALLEKQDE